MDFKDTMARTVQVLQSQDHCNSAESLQAQPLAEPVSVPSWEDHTAMLSNLNVDLTAARAVASGSSLPCFNVLARAYVAGSEGVQESRHIHN